MITNKKNEKIERITNQKKIILDYLKSVTCYPSAETIYLAVKKKIPKISRGTIYRSLKKFKDNKEIQEILIEASRYDGDVSSHTHFICEKCSKFFNLFNVCKNVVF